MGRPRQRPLLFPFICRRTAGPARSRHACLRLRQLRGGRRQLPGTSRPSPPVRRPRRKRVTFSGCPCSRPVSGTMRSPRSPRSRHVFPAPPSVRGPTTGSGQQALPSGRYSPGSRVPDKRAFPGRGRGSVQCCRGPRPTGKAFEGLGQRQDASSWYRKAVEDPSGGAPAAEAGFRLGSAQMRSGDFGSARGSLARVVLVASNTPFVEEALFSLAECELALGNPAEAQKRYQTLVSVYPATAHAEAAAWRLAECAWQLGDLPTAGGSDRVVPGQVSGSHSRAPPSASARSSPHRRGGNPMLHGTTRRPPSSWRRRLTARPHSMRRARPGSHSGRACWQRMLSGRQARRETRDLRKGGPDGSPHGSRRRGQGGSLGAGIAAPGISRRRVRRRCAASSRLPAPAAR